MQKQFTEDDEEYLQDVMGLLEDGVLPKGLTKKLVKELNDLKDLEPLKILGKSKQGYLQNIYKTRVGMLQQSLLDLEKLFYLNI